MSYDFGYSSYSKTGHSQSDEETYILRHCPPIGRFLDIGAYDGITFSNTRALLEKGWIGVYVEPCPIAVEKLDLNTKLYWPNVTIVTAAITEETGDVLFYPSGEMVGSLIKGFADRWYPEPLPPVEVYALTPQTLFELLAKDESIDSRTIDTDFDMISIDVEGTNKELFELMPWDELSPSVIVIEHDCCPNIPHDMIKRLADRYHVVYGNKENIVFARNQ